MTRSDRPYHHGDLKEALLRAVERTVLGDGLDALSLRGCARAAGVSPGAPAHHFGDKRGLLTEFAVEGFEHLRDTIQRELARSPDTALGRLLGVGLGYIRAALDHPAHFQVMQRSELINREDPRLRTASALDLLRTALTDLDQVRDRPVNDDADRALLAWCTVHGFASLWLDGGDRAGYAFGGSTRSALRHAERVLRWCAAGLDATEPAGDS